MSAEQKATLQQNPNKPHKQGPWNTWIEDSVRWMQERKWIKETEAAAIIAAARKTHEVHKAQETQIKILNLGEGYRSIERGIHTKYPEAKVTGADRRGFTYTGQKHGEITAEIRHDWTNQKTDLITAISKKASTAPSKWTLVTLEPECTLFSATNAMNQKNGSAHGKWAESEQNKAAAAPGRVEDERRMYQEAKEGVMTQLQSLERHPGIPFALENPATSELWDLQEVKEIVNRNPRWITHEIDRCAYGRDEKKPTRYLTNIESWDPKGRTGNGRCKAGACTGKITSSGRTIHPRQTVANTKQRRVNQGAKTGGRREFTRGAVINAIEPELILEILESVLPATE